MKSKTIAIFTERLGKQSETFVRQNIERLNGGETVVVCRYLVDAPFDWIAESRVLVLGRYPRWTWGAHIAWFCWRHRVGFAVVEFLNWACALQPFFRFLGLRYVALGHGFDVSRYLQSKEGYAERLNRLSSAVALLVPSEFLKSVLLQATRLPAGQVAALPCGVDLSRFAFSPSALRGRLVFVGRFVEKKAPLLLLEAFKCARHSGAALQLRLGGDGPLLDAAQAYVIEQGLSEHVTFLGVLSHAAVYEEIRSATAVVQHSITAANGDTEGLPVILQEALAVGTPVVATEHSGIPEIVTHGRHGYLVAEKDVTGMAAAMVQVSQLPDAAYAAMRQACRVQAETLLSRDRRIDWIDAQIDD
jgi:colanic acid/amylovoran biosynthesis glycosyltransferase